MYYILNKKPLQLIYMQGLDEDWLPDRGKYPNFSVELILGLNNAKNGRRWKIVY